MSWRTASAGLGLILVAGCLYHPVDRHIEATVCDLAAKPRDVQPLSAADPTAAPADATPVKPASYQDDKDPPPPPKKKGEGKPDDDLPIPKSRLTIPSDLLPGGAVPPIDIRGSKAEREKTLERLLPPLPAVGTELEPVPGPTGKPYTLSDLQQLALSNNPRIKQAVADVEAALRGAAIQAGLPPNPTLGYEGDTMGTTGGPGYQGGYFEQTIKTGNKLQLARAVATMDMRNAELALRKAQTDLTSKVRGDYFAVLVALQSMKLNRALVRFTTDVYNIQVEQVRKGGFAAPYEPMYLRALATQARAALIQARNRYVSAWKQLAADLGLPGLPPTQLAGRIDIPVPVFDHQQVLARVLAGHTDILTADVTYQQSQLQLAQARVQPLPDVHLRFLLQKDRTGPPQELSPSLAVSFELPVWDRNQGGILQAEAKMARAREEAHRARSDLAGTLAEAFERYENSRVLLSYYRDQVLPDLVRVYRGVYERYQRELPGRDTTPPGFGDVVVAQQNLANAVTTYISTLGDMWRAVVDVANLLQTDDLFGVQGHHHDVAVIPELDKLPALPCCHPCSPLPGAHQQVIDGLWPTADPGLPAGDRGPMSRPATVPPVPAKEEKKDPDKAEVKKPDPILTAPPPWLPPVSGNGLPGGGLDMLPPPLSAPPGTR